MSDKCISEGFIFWGGRYGGCKGPEMGGNLSGLSRNSVESALTPFSSPSRLAGSPLTMWRRIIRNTAELRHTDKDKELQAVIPG